MTNDRFDALLLSLPSKDKTVRMRIWRALHGIGCGVLRDGVYLLDFLDIGGIPVADASGLELVLKGARNNARSDDEFVLAAATVFDHVYLAYQSVPATEVP